MTTRRRAAGDEPLLFDLPLGPPEREPAPARAKPRGARPTQPSLFAEDDADDYDDALEIVPAPPTRLEPEPAEGVQEAPGGPVIAGVVSRLLAGLADVVLHLGVLAGVYLGLVALDVEPRIHHWPALATLLAAFSFLSSVVSLAFWGQTAGMAWRGLHTRDRLQRPLTFRQAMLRWAGGLATFAGAGLPLLFALGGASLADWLSRSVTYQAAGSGPSRS